MLWLMREQYKRITPIVFNTIFYVYWSHINDLYFRNRFLVLTASWLTLINIKGRLILYKNRNAIFSQIKGDKVVNIELSKDNKLN